MLKKIAIVVGVFVLALLGGALAGSQRAHQSIAGPVGDSYLLADFEIQYPFVDRLTEEVDEGRAGVQYSAAWSRGVYPGELPCTIVLTDAGGNVVGERHFLLTSASRFAPAEEPFVPVTVSGAPSAASGGCEGGEPPSGAGYVFGAPDISRSEIAGRAELKFDVSWVGKEPPGQRTCTLEVLLTDGTTQLISFGLYLGTPSESVALVPAVGVRQIADTVVNCRVPT
jgi:hypothetical protein